MHLTHVEAICFLLVMGFISAFFDAIVGGGGLISVPALLFVGLPPAVTLGTNKLAGSVGAFTSTMSYLKSGKIQFSLIKYVFPLSVIGAVFGSATLHLIPSSFLRPLVLIMLVAVTLYTLLKKNIGESSTFSGVTRKIILLCAVVAFVIGFYDGFFGPGTGSFLTIAFTLLGFDFVQSAGNAKALNFGSNISALVTFMFMHTIDYQYGVPMAIGMVFGALLGAQFAIRKGPVVVRPLFILATVAMIGDQMIKLL